MSIDSSLKTKGSLARHRNVLKRSERIEKLIEEDRWEEGDSLLGLPKVGNRKATVGKKTSKKEAAEEAKTEEGAAQ